MTKINDGGPAFPSTSQSTPYWEYGMSLRDYFAAKAMQGAIANATGAVHELGNFDPFAAICYSVADAMIAARTHSPDEVT